jgi:hypothetical protein
MDTVSGTVMVAITSAGVLRTTSPKPEVVAAVLMASIMLDAKDASAAAVARLSATASHEEPHATTYVIVKEEPLWRRRLPDGPAMLAVVATPLLWDMSAESSVSTAP